MKRFISMFIVCCFVLSCSSVFAASSSPIWKADGIRTPIQCEAYYDIYKDVRTRFEEYELKYWSKKELSDYTELYVSEYDLNKNVSFLWFCGVELHEYEPEDPRDLYYLSQMHPTMKGCTPTFNELYIWDNTTQKLTLFNHSDENIYFYHVVAGGIKVFTIYNGHDADGKTFEAFYPFVDGNVSSTPSWCRAYLWMYYGDLVEEGIETNKSREYEVQQYTNMLNRKGYFPNLSFDMSTLQVEDFNEFEIYDGGTAYSYFATVYGGNVSEAMNDEKNPRSRIQDNTFGTEKLMDFGDVWKRRDVWHIYDEITYFNDVLPEDWYYDAVQWGALLDIARGTDVNVFSPDQVCTMMQIALFLYRAEGSPVIDELASETDNFLAWAYSLDLFSADEIRYVTPQLEKCTRANAVCMLYKVAGKQPVEFKQIFDDVLPAAYFSDAAIWAYDNHIVAGTDKNTFSPYATCTRGMIMTLIYRYYSL